MAESGSKSPRQPKGRQNKIYRTPPTPPPGELRVKEKSFVLDCKATSSISCDYSKVNPKLGPVIPPYNSQRDKHVDQYFTFYGVDRTLNKTGQVRQPRKMKTVAFSVWVYFTRTFMYLVMSLYILCVGGRRGKYSKLRLSLIGWIAGVIRKHKYTHACRPDTTMRL